MKSENNEYKKYLEAKNFLEKIENAKRTIADFEHKCYLKRVKRKDEILEYFQAEVTPLYWVGGLDMLLTLSYTVWWYREKISKLMLEQKISHDKSRAIEIKSLQTRILPMRKYLIKNK